jgi:hypothetical protein
MTGIGPITQSMRPNWPLGSRFVFKLIFDADEAIER